jgi:ATP-dependent helicase/nuclease subunit A
LQTIQNPQLDIPLAAVLASPVFEFTADDLAVFRGKNKKCSVYDAIYRDDSTKSKEFVAFLQKLRKESRMRSVTELLETIFVETRMDSIYRAMDPEKADNLQTFYQLAADFEAGGQRDLGRFLEHLDAMEDKGLIVGAEQSGSGAVTIMSIHKSKGLEFPVVFLSGLGREFNRESQRAQVLCHKELGIGIAAADAVRRVRYPTVAKRAISARIGAESVSEELRVLYVAMTRAKDRLIMTYASRSLEGELQDMVARMNMGCKELLTREAGCPGEWVLLAALTRIEAGELFNLGGKPCNVRAQEHPWLIRVKNAPMEEGFGLRTEEKIAFPKDLLTVLQKNLSFTYGHDEATRAPSKQTATQRKGRLKDQEAAENTPEPKPIHRSWRKPAFVEQSVRGTEYGTAIHTLLQFIDYNACGDAVGVQREVDRLVEDGILTEQMGEMVPVDQIAAFFGTELGQRIRFGKEVLREFKFSILDNGEAYGDGLEGEEILLQGVVDCAIVEPDGLTIVDFKTDRVTEQTLEMSVAGYKPQVDAYADAMSRIFDLPVKEKSLYFFRLGKLLVL